MRAQWILASLTGVGCQTSAVGPASDGTEALAETAGEDGPTESGSAGSAGSTGTATGSGTDTDSAGTASGTGGDATASGTAGDATGDATTTTESATATGDGDGDESTAGDATATDGSTDGSTGGSTGGDGIGSPSECECADNTELIYGLSDTGGLWSYDPSVNAWALISTPNCPAFNPFSMAVQRDGSAWMLNWSDSRLYRTDVNDPSGSCAEITEFAPFQYDFDVFGMAFVSNSMQDPCEQLYLFNADWTTPDGRLGRVYPEGDPLFIQPVGDTFDYASELTGNANGRLFAFSYGAAPSLVEWRKSDAVELSRETLPFSNQGAWAFAHWNGDFYFFTDPGVGGSIVTHYDFTGAGTFTEVGVAPATILGAGVSTCAPAPS